MNPTIQNSLVSLGGEVQFDTELDEERASPLSIEGAAYNNRQCDAILFTEYCRKAPAFRHEGKVLPNFHGIAIYDCWPTYWKYDVKHGVCCAHLLRELNGAEEIHPSQKWPKAFQSLLLKMKAVKDEAVLSELDQLEADVIEQFDRAYDRIIKKAYRENPVQANPSGRRERPKREKILSLIDRLRDLKVSTQRLPIWSSFLKTFFWGPITR